MTFINVGGKIPDKIQTHLFLLSATTSAFPLNIVTTHCLYNLMECLFTNHQTNFSPFSCSLCNSNRLFLCTVGSLHSYLFLNLAILTSIFVLSIICICNSIYHSVSASHVSITEYHLHVCLFLSIVYYLHTLCLMYLFLHIMFLHVPQLITHQLFR